MGTFLTPKLYLLLQEFLCNTVVTEELIQSKCFPVFKRTEGD